VRGIVFFRARCHPVLDRHALRGLKGPTHTISEWRVSPWLRSSARNETLVLSNFTCKQLSDLCESLAPLEFELSEDATWLRLNKVRTCQVELTAEIAADSGHSER
jgi:hypothetical protein